MNFRTDYLLQFTDDPSFQSELEKLLKEVKDRVARECLIHGDTFAQVGLPALAVNCQRKAGRIFARVIKDKPGSNDFQHELDDLLEYAIYTNLYYRILRRAYESTSLQKS